MKEVAEKEAAKEEMPEPKKVGVASIIPHVCSQKTETNIPPHLPAEKKEEAQRG